MTQITTNSGQTVTSQQALTFAASVGNDYAKVAAKAKELGLNSQEGKKFLAEVFKTDVRTVSNYLDSNASASTSYQPSASSGLPYPSTSPNTSSSPKSTVLTPTQASVIRKAVHGSGNAEIKDEDIQAFVAAAQSDDELIAGMVYYDVNATQVGRALGMNAEQVQGWLHAHGADETSLKNKEVENYVAMTPPQASAVFKAVHGAGNKSISNEEIQAWFSQPRQPREVIAAMTERGISASQVGEALGLNPQRLEELLAEYGVDQHTLINREVDGWSDEDLQSALTEMPDKQSQIDQNQSNLKTQYGYVEPLMDDARAAQDIAAQKKSEFDALNAKFEPAFAEYTKLSQELTSLEGVVQGEQAQKANAQNVLANLGAIDKDRDRRATAERDANYQITNADQKITDAQTRIAAIRAQMQQLETWGAPLMAQTQAARAEWDQASKQATEKSEIAGAQGGVVSWAARDYRAGVTDLVATNEKIALYLKANPELAAAQEAKQVVQETNVFLNETLTQQREWVDSARDLGIALDAEATGLETDAAKVKPALDAVLPARMSAEADIGQKQEIFNSAQAKETKAQADLDAAYVQRDKANYAEGKGGRNRARDEANRLIDLYSAQLTSATQERIAAQAALESSKSAGLPAIENSLDADGEWRAASTIATNARNQSIAQLDIANQLTGLEVFTQNAIATSYAQVISLSQAEINAAKEAANAGELDLQGLSAIGKSAQVDLQNAIGDLTQLEQTAVNDRVMAEQQRGLFTSVQTQAYGQQLVADTLMTDAAKFQQIHAGVGVEELETKLVAAETRLNQAKYNAEMADMHLDWAQARSNPKKQNKAIKASQPKSDAAEAELIQAQQEYDVIRTQLDMARHMAAPLEQIVQESTLVALNAVQDADVLTTQASVQGTLLGMARARVSASDGVLAAAQLGVAQGTRALAEVQGLLAGETTDTQASELLAAESQRGLAWADEFTEQVAETRQSQLKTDFEQGKLDALTIQVGGLQALSHFLETHVVEMQQSYEAAKADLPSYETAFLNANQQSNVSRSEAEAAYADMVNKGKQAEVDFILSRKPPAPTDRSKYEDVVIAMLTEKQTDHPEAARLLSLGSQGAQEVIAALGTQADPSTTIFSRLGFTPEEVNARVNELINAEKQKVRQEAIDNADEFIASADKAQMAQRKTQRKKLHWYDDKAIYVEGNAEFQAARARAMDLIARATESSQAALDTGQTYQAHIAAAALRGNWLLDKQTQLADVAHAMVELGGEAAQQSRVLGQTAAAEENATQEMLQSLVEYSNTSVDTAQKFSRAAGQANNSTIAGVLSDTADSLERINDQYKPAINNAQVIVEVSKQISEAAFNSENIWKAATQEFAQNEKTQESNLAKLKTTIEGDQSNFDARLTRVADDLQVAFETNFLARATSQSIKDQIQDVKELHQDRLAADQVHKKQKKKAMFAQIVNAAVMVAAALAAIPTAGTSLEAAVTVEALLAEVATSAALFTAANFSAQGINLAAGFQDKLDMRTALMAGSTAVFVTAAGLVARTVASGLRQAAFMSPVADAPVALNPVAEFLSKAPIIGPKIPDAVASGLSWTIGGALGNMAQQGFNLATGLSKEFSLENVKFAMANWGYGGLIHGLSKVTYATQLWLKTPMLPVDNQRYIGIFFERAIGLVAHQALMQASGFRKDMSLVEAGVSALALSTQLQWTRLLGNEAVVQSIGSQAIAEMAARGVLRLALDLPIETIIGAGWGEGFGLQMQNLLLRQYVPNAYGKGNHKP